jgi:hypothetical protein
MIGDRQKMTRGKFRRPPPVVSGLRVPTGHASLRAGPWLFSGFHPQAFLTGSPAQAARANPDSSHKFCRIVRKALPTLQNPVPEPGSLRSAGPGAASRVTSTRD